MLSPGSAASLRNASQFGSTRTLLNRAVTYWPVSVRSHHAEGNHHTSQDRPTSTPNPPP
ncbi:hypothetical protein [Sporisorium scitamineum]|uniref:Uncharacterized protein n=1 Tax=Sporisorium scitamineum TaxID=49012 RepID=A0A0F7S8V5_9BASI|nr:hypothetical protein [Sporisorium scitamineum]